MYRKLLSFLVALVFISTFAYAGGSGNCIRPLRTTTDYLGAGAAFEYNYVHQRLHDMDNSKSAAKSMKVEHFHQYYGKILFGLGDRFNIYAKIGGAVYDLEFTDKSGDRRMDITLDPGLYTGAGFNTLYPLFDIENLSIGFDVQGNFFMNSVKDITRSGQGATGVSGSFYGVEGESSVYFTYKFELYEMNTVIVPYVGAYHSWILVGTLESLSYQTPRDGFENNRDFRPAYDLTSFGVLLGVDIDISRFVNINVEGRLVGETAITTGVTIKY